jgi:hypothetical protein
VCPNREKKFAGDAGIARLIADIVSDAAYLGAVGE